MKEDILENYRSLAEFARKINVTPQRLNYWLKRGEDLNPILKSYIYSEI